MKRTSTLLCLLATLSLTYACSDESSDNADANSTANKNTNTNVTTTNNTGTTVATGNTTPTTTSKPTSGEMDMSQPKEDMGSGGDKDMNIGGGEDMTVTPDSGGACVDTPLFDDKDKDGKGAGDSVKTECLLPNQSPSDGLATEGGDCNDNDPLQYPGASGVCGDRVDDSCSGDDEKCPASMPAQMNQPNWDRNGAPPSSVYAWAKFEPTQGVNLTAGCFVIFAGAKDRFFTQRVGLAKPSQGQLICNSNGGRGYDRRAYAFTLSGESSACPGIDLMGSRTSKVSNDCRKLLYYIGDIAQNDQQPRYSFVATKEADLKKRLDNFNKVEIACVQDSSIGGNVFPHQTLLESQVQLNTNFVMPSK